MMPLFLLAIFAPAIASNQPFVFYDWRARGPIPGFPPCSIPTRSSTMCSTWRCVGFLPWLALCGATEFWGRRRGLVGPAADLALMLAEFAGLLVVLCALFDDSRRCDPQIPRGPAISAKNSIGPPETKHGIYPPFPSARPRSTWMPRSSHRCIASRRIARKKPTTAFVHLLGTDNTGRDVLALMLYGTRISMTVGFVAVGIYRHGRHRPGSAGRLFRRQDRHADLAHDRDRVVVPLVLSDPDAGGPDRPAAFTSSWW